MAVGGAQSVDGVSMHEAYRFQSRPESDLPDLEGFVCKIGKLWEARIEGTPIRPRGETRKEAVELALRQLRALGES